MRKQDPLIECSRGLRVDQVVSLFIFKKFKKAPHKYNKTALFPVNKSLVL